MSCVRTENQWTATIAWDEAAYFKGTFGIGQGYRPCRRLYQPRVTLICHNGRKIQSLPTRIIRRAQSVLAATISTTKWCHSMHSIEDGALSLCIVTTICTKRAEDWGLWRIPYSQARTRAWRRLRLWRLSILSVLIELEWGADWAGLTCGAT